MIQRQISIHTSAKEVTACMRPQSIFMMISIHTSAKEVTEWGIPVLSGIVDFNPHFREGSDVEKWCTGWAMYHFNPHFREGSDERDTAYFAFDLRFQSTLPRRKWPGAGQKYQDADNFNPHFREGSDIPVLIIGKSGTDFNPHFREGSDQEIHLDKIRCPYFNPHFREGSDLSCKMDT